MYIIQMLSHAHSNPESEPPEKIALTQIKQTTLKMKENF